MECKSTPSFTAHSAYLRINRNIVECKLVFYDEIKKGEQELIETLWNVNYVKVQYCNITGYGINRNIVECK